nr:MAG TPA: hypothetical protein [Caudoviricetes sp.]
MNSSRLYRRFFHMTHATESSPGRKHAGEGMIL